MADEFTSYGWSQGLSDFLGGWMGETGKIREENERQQQRQLEIEQTALQHLMTSDDPGVKAAAVTAWLTPRKAGPGPLAKWFGDQERSPVFNQVQTILGPAGKQPWLTVQQREAQQAQGAIEGKSWGMAQAYQNLTGQWPDEEMSERFLAGLSGYPQRVIQHQYGNFVIRDPVTGKEGTKAGYVNVDPRSGTSRAFDFNNQPIAGEIIAFHRTESQARMPGRWIWATLTDPAGGKTQRYIYKEATGEINPPLPPGVTVVEEPPPSQLPAPGLIPPSEGRPAQTVVGGRKPGEAAVATDVPGTERPAETPRQTYDRLKALQVRIEQLAKAEDPNILGLDRESYVQALEFWAQKNGYPSYKWLVDQLFRLDQQLRAPQAQPQQNQPQQNQPQNQPQATTGAPPGPIAALPTQTPTTAPQTTAPQTATAAPDTRQPTISGSPRLSSQQVNDVLNMLRDVKRESPPPPR